MREREEMKGNLIEPARQRGSEESQENTHKAQVRNKEREEKRREGREREKMMRGRKKHVIKE